MASPLDLLLRARLHSATTVFRASISMSPVTPTPGGDQAVFVVLTADAGGSIIITQSGDLVDADFDNTLVNVVDAAATADANTTFNTGTRRLTFAAAGVFTFLRTITSDPPAGEDYTLTISAPLGGLVLGIATATFTTTEEVIDPVPNEDFLWGAGQSSGEFGTTGTGMALGGTYTYPSALDLAYSQRIGLGATRLAYRAGRVQPTVGGALSEPDMVMIDAAVAASGAHPIILDCHEFEGRRPTPSDAVVKIGQLGYTVANHVNLLLRLDTRYPANNAVWLGVFNEPQGPSFTAVEWRDIAIQIIELYVGGGGTKKLVMSMAFWTGAHSIVSSGNAAAWARSNFTAPQLALIDAWVIFDLHQYLDGDSSGTSDVATPGAGSTRLIDATNFLRANGWTAVLGEVGFANNPQMITEVRALTNYALANPDVWLGIFYWGFGPWWGLTYIYLLQPGNNTTNPVHRPQIFTIADYSLPYDSNVDADDIALSNSVLSASGAIGQKIGTLTTVGGDPNDLPVWTMTDNAGNRLNVVGEQEVYGSVAPTAGQTYQGTIQRLGRNGHTIQRTFSHPALAAPNIGLTRVGAATVDEGDNFVLRYAVSAIVPGVKWRIWCSGNVPAQMVGTWESVVRPAFEARGFSVRRVNSTTDEIEMLPGSLAGNTDVTWATKADATTEGVNFQANFFMDTAQGCTLSPAVLSNFIADTSLTPGWSIALPGSVFPGESFTAQISLVNPSVGAKVIITPSGTSADSDFAASFDTVMGAAATANGFCTWNAGTNELAITNVAFAGLSPEFDVLNDADSDETFILTLSAPTNSVIAVASDTILIRHTPASATVHTVDFGTDVTPTTRAGVVQYKNSDGTLTPIAANLLCNGDRGVLLGPAFTEFVKNPRFEGGAAGTTTKPTGVAISGAAWTFDGIFDHNGVPEARFTRNYTASDSARSWAFGAITDIPAVVGQLYTMQIGLRKVSGGDFPNPKLVLYGFTAAQANGQQLIGDEVVLGPETTRAEWTRAFTTVGTAFLRPQLSMPAIGAIGPVTIAFSMPSVQAVPSFVGPEGLINSDARERVPPLTPIGILGSYGTDAIEIEVNANIDVPTEGTVILEFDSVTRYGGECLLSIYSDADNYIEVRQEIFGALGVYVAKNGVLSVELNDPLTETEGGYVIAGAENKLALVYGLFDVRLVHDGRLLCSASPSEMPLVDKIRFGRDRNGENQANIYLRPPVIRDDLRSTVDLIADTKLAGLARSPGINRSGAEFGSKFPGTNRVDYFFTDPVQTIKSAGALYWNAKMGVGDDRLPVKWQRLQPELLGGFEPGYLALLKANIDGNWAAGRGTIIDIHNYARYVVNQAPYTQVPSTLIGTAPVTAAAYYQFMQMLADEFDGYPGVVGIDGMNEPGWITADAPTFTQGWINAVAAGSPTMPCYVEGKSASGMATWPRYNAYIHALTHPFDDDLIIPSGHSYYDNNRSGTYAGSYSVENATPETALWNMLPFIQTCIAFGHQDRLKHVGETGFPMTSTIWHLTGSNGVKLYHHHKIKVSGWTGGEAWSPSYSQNMEPTGGIGAKVDKAGLVAYSRHKFQS